MSDSVTYISDPLSDAEKKAISDGFTEYQLDYIPTDESPTPFCIKAYDGKKFIGNVDGTIFLGALRISTLFIQKGYRGKGIARSLMKQAEELGIESNCRFARVSTFSFQAPDFYKRFGYTIDYIQDGYAHDTSKLFLSKELSS